MDDSALAIFCGSRAAAGSLISSLIFFCCARMGSWTAAPGLRRRSGSFQMGKITLLIAHPPLISGLGFKEKGEFGI